MVWIDQEMPGVQNVRLIGSGVPFWTRRHRVRPDSAHLSRLADTGPIKNVVVLLALLVHVFGNHGLGNLGRKGAPVAVFLEDDDGDFRIAPWHHADKPRIRSAGPALYVGVAAAYHLGGAGLSGKVDSLDMRALGRVVQTWGGGGSHAVGNGHPGVFIERHRLIARAGE